MNVHGTRSLALDIPLGEIISRATRGNKKGQRARRKAAGQGTRRRAQISIRRLRGRGIIASIISAGCTRPLFLGSFFFFFFFIFGSMSAPGRKRPDV